MARKTGLGRGLGAIFGTDVVESVEESLHQPEKKEENHVSRETCELLNGLGHREILQYQKVAKSKIKLPRQN